MPNVNYSLSKRFPWRRTTIYPGGSPDFVNTGVNTFTDVYQRTGVKLPGWKRIIASGGAATTPLSGLKHTFRAVSADFSWYFKDRTNPLHIKFGGETYQGLTQGNLWGLFPGVANASLAAAENLALTHLYRNIRSSQRSAQGGVILGELRETIKMLRQPANALRKGFSDYLSAVRSRTRGVSSDNALRGAISGTWLEYRLGLTPLLSDVDDIAKAIADIQTRRFQTRATGTGISEQAADSFVRLGTIRCSLFRYKKYHVVYRSGLGQLTPGISTDLGRLGLSLNDFVPTVWELIPYSFVVDYFTNIGDILDAATTSISNVLWTNKSVISEDIYRYSFCVDQNFVQNQYGPDYDTFSLVGSPEFFEHNSRSVTRTNVVNLGIPSFKVELPSLGQTLNLAALLDQATNTSKDLSGRRFR